MATAKQIQANRLNASKSTGLKSLIGKMIASRNSTKHSLYSTTVLLPTEDGEEFLRLARRLVSAYNPCGVREEELVRTIIEIRWQLRRANLVDSELFQIYGFYKGKNRGVGTAFAQDAAQGNAFTKATHYQSSRLRNLRMAEQDLSCLQAKSAQALPISQATLLLPQPGPEASQETTAKELAAPALNPVALGSADTFELKPMAQQLDLALR
jgi:hypothetical protein